MKVKIRYDDSFQTVEVTEEECESMIRADYEERRANAEDPSMVEPRTMQEILDAEFNRPEYNNYKHEHRYTLSADARIYEGIERAGFVSLSNIMFNQTRFNLSALFEDHPEYLNIIGSNGKDKRFRNNIFDKVTLFTEQAQKEDDISVLGVIANKRVIRYINKDYVDLNHENLFNWKVLIVRVNGTGALGETLSTPVISKPGQGYTQTFIGIGAFDTEIEAQNTLKYIKTKFLRTMLSTLKITQDNSIETWRMIPVQNVTATSDIDWSQSVADIDRQLYRKYGLDDTEIAFIESHVKEMA